MSFVAVWLTGLINPARSFEQLKGKPAPGWGFWAVLIRFVVTSIFVTLPLYLLGREPFTSSSLTYLATNNYYLPEMFFLPIFGVTIWLLMSAFAHVVIRLTGKRSDFDLILNIVGLGMLIPIPVVWAWDITMITLNMYVLPVMAISHSIFQLWETSIEAVGFIKLLRIRVLPAICLSLIINAIYVAFAATFIR